MGSISIKEVNLSFRTPHQRIDIFSNLNLGINKGDFVVVFGPSGFGKTSLLNLISGCLKPNEGKIFIGDKDITSLDDIKLCQYRNKTIGYLFQTFNLISSFNLRENLSIPLIISGYSKKEALEKADSLMKEYGIYNRAYEYPHTLSGGEQQRAAFARAVINNPQIILADEPTANLDKGNSQVVLNSLLELNNKGTTIVCVTHDEKIIDAGQHKIDIEKICQLQQ